MNDEIQNILDEYAKEIMEIVVTTSKSKDCIEKLARYFLEREINARIRQHNKSTFIKYCSPTDYTEQCGKVLMELMNQLQQLRGGE